MDTRLLLLLPFSSSIFHTNNDLSYLLGTYTHHAAMVMESLTRANNQSRLMDIDQTLSNLQQLNLVQYMSNSNHRKLLMERMEVNLIAFRQIDADGVAHIHTFCDDDSEKVEISAAAFDCLKQVSNPFVDSVQSVQQVSNQFPRSVQTVYHKSTRRLQQVYKQPVYNTCTTNVQYVNTKCTSNVQQMFDVCPKSVRTVYTHRTTHVQQIHIRPPFG